jgi:glycosyltransferase involved in cell wall biosynthesis
MISPARLFSPHLFDRWLKRNRRRDCRTHHERGKEQVCVKNLLFVAFQFPPFNAGSGVHRAARFSCYLPEHGWSPYVVTAHTRAYERITPGTERLLPSSVQTKRVFALDTPRHLAIRGRYPRILSLPDRWVSWALAAVPVGVRLIYSRKIEVILVTFPLATTVLIGLILQWLTGKPLVVDFRDSMTEDGYPRDPVVRKVSVWIEKSAINRGARFIFTTPSTRLMYLKRYPQLRFDDCIVIPNGFDEDDFSGITVKAETPIDDQHSLRLVHSGIIYPDDRDPSAFFKAVQRLKKTNAISSKTVRIDLRASGSESAYRAVLEELGIEDIVRLTPAVSHRDALLDIATADGLLLFQAASCDHQIPAKVYEYLRIAKPILALTSFAGDTAALLNETGGATVTDLADEKAIAGALSGFLDALRKRTHPVPDQERVQTYTRRHATRQLANVLDSVLNSAAADAERYPAR